MLLFFSFTQPYLIYVHSWWLHFLLYLKWLYLKCICYLEDILTYFKPLLKFYIPWKRQKTSGFQILVFYIYVPVRKPVFKLILAKTIRNDVISSEEYFLWLRSSLFILVFIFLIPWSVCVGCRRLSSWRVKEQFF